VELCLEGGRAFGTGEHSTTRLCCAWLERTLKQFNSNTATAATARVLDYGSGSGLLGFAALKYGAAEAVGLEVDVDSIVSSLYNAEVNDLDMTFYHPREISNSDDQRLQVELRRITAADTELGYEASSTLAQSELQQFDITVANILAACLVRVAPVIADMTKPGGLLAVSGVLNYQADSVIAGFTDDFDDVKVAETENEWVLITGVRKQQQQQQQQQ
jgi:ribosomal protein L11 methyltransferase